MAKEQQEGGKPTRMVDIAATLLQQSPTGGKPAEEQEDPAVLAAVTESDDADWDEEDQSPDGGYDEDDDETIEASDDDEGDEQEGDEQPDEDDDETDYLDVRDDDLITVLVDGEEQEVSIGDLKRAHSGEGAIEKRLQEATETRKAAIAERTQALEKLAAEEQSLMTALDGLDDNLFKGVIPPPDERTKSSNPDQYYRHKEAYENDQKRISDARALIEGKRKEVAEQREQRLQEFGRQAAEIIAREIPELTNPKTADATFRGMAQTAASYGYTQEEINHALDPRMFMLVRDAMKYRNMIDKTKERNPKDLEDQKVKKVRRLRSGNTQAKTRARRGDQNRKAALDKARKTGKPADVAATLLVPRG